MSNYNHQQVPVAYPAAASSAPPQVMAPPPMGYPTKDDHHGEDHLKHSSDKTTIRGDGFWKGCCAALCCCCLLDACF